MSSAFADVATPLLLYHFSYLVVVRRQPAPAPCDQPTTSHVAPHRHHPSVHLHRVNSQGAAHVR